MLLFWQDAQHAFITAFAAPFGPMTATFLMVWIALLSEINLIVSSAKESISHGCELIKGEFSAGHCSFESIRTRSLW